MILYAVYTRHHERINGTTRVMVCKSEVERKSSLRQKYPYPPQPH